MRHLLLSLILWCCALTVSAQTVNQVRQRINTVAAQMKTMECDFVQTKTVRMLNSKLISRGKMYYQQTGKLRWQYLSPYQYTFVLNGNQVKLKSQGRNDVINVEQNKMFKEITRIMMNSVLGKCVDSSRDFKVALSGSGNNWKALMTPQSKTMKQMFQSISVVFNYQRGTVSAVQLVEKNGDKTVIVLKNVKSNQPLHADLFSIR
ncbi:MAG: outer membrane lipoprotein carrier protein LolA [Prevotella sp.]|nr:outer membrane lipoprotein carrier protein LolA [Prevotella sp.]